MNLWRDFRLKCAALFRKERLDADVDQEIHSHIEMQARANIEAGMKPEESRHAAMRWFGSTETVKEICREQRGVLWLEHFLQDVRYAVRMLRKNPGFTAVAVVTLALGIGVNTAVFSILAAVLLRPLPYPDAERLVELNESHRKDSILSEYGVSVPNYRDWRAASRSFSHLGIHFYSDFWLKEGDQLRPVRGRYVSADVLPTLGVVPLFGRELREEDEKAGGVVVLGHELSRRLFGAETNLTGKIIEVNNQHVEVVGVMPSGFSFPSRTELWMPLPESKEEFRNRGWQLGAVIGRLSPGVSTSQAQSEMDSIARQLEEQYPKENRDWGIRVASLHSKMIAPVRRTLPILIGVAIFVLLIACANLGNLLLSRSLARQKELAIRAAVGAGSARLIRQLITESLMLSIIGAAAGFMSVLWSRSLWLGLAGSHLPRFAVIKIDASVWFFTLAVAVFTGLFCGLVPAMRVWWTDLHEILKEGGQRPAAERASGWIRSGLVIVQVSLALVLLIGAGLALKSIYYLLHPGLQVDPRKVLVLNISLPKSGYPEDAQRLEFFEGLATRLKAWPTVEATGAASFIAFGSGMRSGIVLEDHPDGPDAPTRWTFSCDASPAFFTTIGVPILRGRDLNATDRKGAPEVALISETMAQRYWPGEDPIGKRFAGGQGPNHGQWVTVVGVVRDLRPGGLESGRRAEYYNCWYQHSFINTLVVRTTVAPAKLKAQIQAVLREMDRTLPNVDMQTLDELLDNVASDTRTLGTLLVFFAALALVLAVVGIYGVIAYAVGQRTHEFGVRMALGAQRADVVLLVLRWGGRLALVGTVSGLVVAWASTRLMASLVEGVSPRDIATFVAVPLVLLIFALIGCYVPACKAARVNPMSALRNE